MSEIKFLLKTLGACLAITCLVINGGALAQAPAPRLSFMTSCSNLACDIQNDWDRNQFLATSLATVMPEDKYSFKPTPAQQSFGERVVHIASVNADMMKLLGGKTPAPKIDEKATSKAAALDSLKKAGDYGMAVLKEFNDQQLLQRVDSPPFMGPKSSRLRLAYFLMTHSQDTYGQLVVYLRLNGITPPASRQP